MVFLVFALRQLGEARRLLEVPARPEHGQRRKRTGGEQTRHTRVLRIVHGEKAIASNGPTIKPIPCMAKTLDIIRPRVFLPANSLAIVALTG